jgi:SagB-type dehydrogenase family enzyme
VLPPDSRIHRYHDGTKHHFHSFARSLGYLDWATQPRPFRSFAGSHSYALYPSPDAHVAGYQSVAVDYRQLFEPVVAPTPLSAASIGDLLRHSLGLSAWKVFGASRWVLRVNPSSGNLHPTEAYVVCGPLAGLANSAAVYHYAPDRHVLEQRCAFDTVAWREASEQQDAVLVALTSIHWRESWKYGERAFRYCQHDLGHAIAAVRLAAAMLGWHAEILPAWSHQRLAALVGSDRDEDFVDAEREEPGTVLLITGGRSPRALAEGADVLLAAVSAGSWTGSASQLSEDHVQWTFIDEVAAASEDPGRPWSVAGLRDAAPTAERDDSFQSARALMLQRRSAVAFDSRTSIDARTFFGMLARVMPGAAPPFDAIWWTPRIHLLLFVHRVTGVSPGLYVLGRDRRGSERLNAEIRGHDTPESAHDLLPLVRLGQGDCRSLARRLSCDQDIAADGCFSLGMIAEFDASLVEYGPSFYRHLFWESGIVGQTLYLEAEAAGVRATGIGCFYDDPVHEVLGLRSHAFQSLYHFTVGIPVEDTRLTTEPGYSWEK